MSKQAAGNDYHNKGDEGGSNSPQKISRPEGVASYDLCQKGREEPELLPEQGYADGSGHGEEQIAAKGGFSEENNERPARGRDRQCQIIRQRQPINEKR